MVDLPTTEIIEPDNLGYLPGSDGNTFYLTATKSVPRSNAVKIMWNHFVRFVNSKL